MIIINGSKIDINRFPDGTPLIKYEPKDNCQITYLYNTQKNEIMDLYFLTRHIQSKGFEVSLEMPYVPNARQDRFKNKDDIFTLKYFCELINSLNYTKVSILDCHSFMTLALLNKVVEIDVYQFIKKAQFSVFAIEQCFPCIFFPDKGAMERYNSMEDLLCIYGEKTRDWKTGIINGVEIKGVVDENKIKNLPILIVDDICSKGGTFYHSALELKRYGFKNIYLYVTHCEPSIFTGDLYRNRKELCKMVFTTNSIINVSSDWIKIL